LKSGSEGVVGRVASIVRTKPVILAVVASAAAAVAIWAGMTMGQARDSFDDINPGPITGIGDSTTSTPDDQLPTTPTDDDTDDTDPDDVQVQPPLPSDFEFTDASFNVLASDPDKYASHNVTISGKIYEVVDQSSSAIVLLTYRIFGQADESDDSRAVIMYQQSRLQSSSIEKGDCIAVKGKVRGGFGEVNSLGQDVRVPLIDSTNVAEMECVNSALPPLETVNMEVTQSLGGVSLTAHKVQLANDHVRIGITARNTDGGDSVFIREKESFMMYGGNTYQNINNLLVFGNYKLDSSLVAESEAEGYMFFEPIQNYDGGSMVFKIIIEKVGISNNTEYTFIFTT
jgi:hypothetical protein